MSHDSPTPLRIQLLGDFALSLDDSPTRSLEKPRQQSLLAYLAFHQGKPQKRTHLAFTFWPDSEEKQALTNLRNLLHGLRQSLPAVDAFLQIDKQSITLLKSPDCSVDTIELEDSLRATDTDSICQNLETTEQLYRGELLPKFYDEWIEAERSALRSKLNETIAQRVKTLRESEKLDEAIRYSKIRIQRDSLSESSHYTLIELLYLSGDKAAALLAYHSYEKRLEADLDISPGEEIRDLHQQILSSQSVSDETKTTTTTPAAPTDEAVVIHDTRLAHWVVWTSGLAAILIAVFYFGFRNPDTPLPLEKSIAILPFENRSHLEEDRYFTDGFHDDLITRISHIPEVKTISRTSVMSYRGKKMDLKKIARELGVATLIEGGVQRSGDQIRINIQLIDATTGFHIWTRNYTRQVSAQNIFALQKEITDSIAQELSPQLAPTKPNQSESIPTKNLAALEEYFRGKSHWSEASSAGYEQASLHLNNAIELDPHFTEAHAILANVYLNQVHYTGLPVQAQLAKAKPHIARALELDNQLSEAYVALGFYHNLAFDLPASAEAYQRAITLNPNNSNAYQLYGTLKLYHMIDAEAALKLAQKGAELDPKNLDEQMTLAEVLITLRKIDQAKQILEPLIEQDPKNVKALRMMGMLYDVGLYRFDEAIRYYREAFALDPANSSLSSSIADAYFDLGDTDAYLEWSERDLIIAPSSNRSTFLRGLAHEFRGETEQAIANYSALKKSDEYYDWSVYKLAAASVKAGRPQDGLDRYILSYPWISDPNLAIDRKNFIQAVDVSFLLYATGQTERATKLAKRLKAFAPNTSRWGKTGNQAYDIPLYIVLGDIDGANAALREFIDGGGALSHLATDPLTHEMHDDPEFKRLIGIINARLEAQKSNLREMEANGELAPIPDLINNRLL